MNERETWQFIGEAFEKFAETGEVTYSTLSGGESLVSCGICHALYNTAPLDLGVYTIIYDKAWRAVYDEKRSATICDYGREYAADRAMFCYLNVAMLEKETENG